MSFEGYTLSLCEKGHLTEGSPYYYAPKKCRECNSKIILSKLFSTTNGDEYEKIQNLEKRKELEQKREEIMGK